MPKNNPDLNPAMAELNRKNHDFWNKQHDLTGERISDPAIVATAIEDAISAQLRGEPVHTQKTFEVALANAEAAKRRFSSQRGQIAGKARKTELLRTLIEDAVRSNPQINEAELHRELENGSGPGWPIEFSTRFISICLPDGRIREVPISGLKDRLSRAKNKLKKDKSR